MCCDSSVELLSVFHFIFAVMTANNLLSTYALTLESSDLALDMLKLYA